MAPLHPQRTEPWYNLSDGAVYYSILTTLRPKRIIEVGCGFSSAIALDVRDQELHDLELTFIEPYPERLYELLKEGDNTTATIHRAIVQDVPIEIFDVLEKDDILFIDSSHMSSPGSDVNLLFFQVLPRLRPGVVVHFHDIFFPFEYPEPGESWRLAEFGLERVVFVAGIPELQQRIPDNVFQLLVWRDHPEIVSRYFLEGPKDLPGQHLAKAGPLAWRDQAQPEFEFKFDLARHLHSSRRRSSRQATSAG